MISAKEIDGELWIRAADHHKAIKNAQRTWVGLTNDEIDQGLVRSNHALQTAGAWRDGVEWATKQLREKNNG